MLLLQDFQLREEADDTVEGDVTHLDPMSCTGCRKHKGNEYGDLANCLQDVTQIRKKKHYGFPNAVEITSKGKRVFFTSLLKRDTAHRLLLFAWNKSRQASFTCQHSICTCPPQRENGSRGTNYIALSSDLTLQPLRQAVRRLQGGYALPLPALLKQTFKQDISSAAQCSCHADIRCHLQMILRLQSLPQSALWTSRR